MFTLQLKQIKVLPGQRVQFVDVSWEDFEIILEQLGEHRASRIAYYQGVLEIRMPLPEHEKIKILIGRLLTLVLDELEMEWDCLGSTTFKSKQMMAGIEPDDCFYIQNSQAMIGKKRFDFATDTPPDLILEIDLTSRTQISAYEALRVPEIWRLEKGKLEIYLLRDGEYVQSETSLNIPNFPIKEAITQFVEISDTAPISTVLKAFRKWVREKIDTAS
ncbi:Uma2 family endonuclease [Ancylothrix sp. C2]|uniref:Uma2 family endonuclease n=1 Tax=Ancylothrix sp. D3o TaxID=2953691 RepID=UPI0021BB25AD|nr:Uma2 family endonuclease [Ancylothrix sp. D3o]MCT7951369.1 Uma2 family endonuclease [Ancylothrix sp. D3o]